MSDRGTAHAALFSIPETKHNWFSDAPHPNREMETSEC